MKKFYIFLSLIIVLFIIFFNCQQTGDSSSGGGSKEGSSDDGDSTPSIWTSQLKIIAPVPGDYDGFGYSVSISGDYAIVGAAYEEDESGAKKGAAYIYHRTGLNTWDTGIKIIAFDAEDDDWFGYSASISESGDYAIVGAYCEDGSGTDRGAAYIYRRTGLNTWDAGTKIIASDTQDYDRYGNSVSISEEYVIIGASSHEDVGGTDRGAAYIYRRTGLNTWGEEEKITAFDATSFDYFGRSVSISGDYAIVGASGENGSGTDRGAAYIYHRIGANAWNVGTKITASDAEDNDYFGRSVSISGDYAIVSTAYEDGSGTDRGAVYIYHRTGTNTWDAGTKITASDAEDNDYFGNSVSISGDYTIIGAYQEDGSGTDRGAAYIYRRIGLNTWDTGIKIIAFDAEDDDWFGNSVSISGDYAIVSAVTENGSGIDRGAAYIFKK